MLPFSFELIYQDWCCLDGAITSSHCSIAKYSCLDRYLPLKQYMIQSLICAHLLIVHTKKVFSRKELINICIFFLIFLAIVRNFAQNWTHFWQKIMSIYNWKRTRIHCKSCDLERIRCISFLYHWEYFFRMQPRKIDGMYSNI